MKPCTCRYYPDTYDGPGYVDLCPECERREAEEFEIDRLAAEEADWAYDREMDELARMGK